MSDLDLTHVLSMPWVVPVVMGCTVGLVAVVGGFIKDCITTIAETNLKRSMVEAGFSPAEIERVVNASGGKPSKAGAIAKGHAKPSL